MPKETIVMGRETRYKKIYTKIKPGEKSEIVINIKKDPPPKQEPQKIQVEVSRQSNPIGSIIKGGGIIYIGLTIIILPGQIIKDIKTFGWAYGITEAIYTIAFLVFVYIVYKVFTKKY